MMVSCNRANSSGMPYRVGLTFINIRKEASLFSQAWIQNLPHFAAVTTHQMILMQRQPPFNKKEFVNQTILTTKFFFFYFMAWLI